MSGRIVGQVQQHSSSSSALLIPFHMGSAVHGESSPSCSILHVVFQHYRPNILMYKAPMPIPVHARPRETRYMAEEKVGLCTHLNPLPLVQRDS